MYAWSRSAFNARFPSNNVDETLIKMRNEAGLLHPGVPRVEITPDTVNTDDGSDDELDDVWPF